MRVVIVDDDRLVAVSLKTILESGQRKAGRRAGAVPFVSYDSGTAGYSADGHQNEWNFRS